MGPLGMLLYGYDESDAMTIRNAIADQLSNDILLYSATDAEDTVIKDIISQPPRKEFREAKPKVLMFLGFDEQQISSSLQNFPQTDGVQRPIFCGLTEHNINWPLKELLKDLLEERRYWQEQQQKAQAEREADDAQ